MRNLKRALSLTLASVMLLGMMIVGTSAAPYTDQDQISNVTEATVLKELEIMVGDGKSFGPTTTVTRGQMAIIICKIMYGNRLNVDTLAKEQKFDDVPANSYFAGYVNFAAEQGIISGYGNGNFGPGDPVSTAQASLMLCRALGYFQGGELSGQGWAANALNAMTMATKLKLFGDLRLNTNDELSRDNVAAMVFNTMTKAVPVMYSDTWKVYYTDSSDLLGGTKFDYLNSWAYQNYDLVYKNVIDDLGNMNTRWGIGKAGDSDTKGNLVDNTVVIAEYNKIIDEENEAILTYTEKKTDKAADIARDLRGYDATNVVMYVNGKPAAAANLSDGSAIAAQTGDGFIVKVYANDSGVITSVSVVKEQLAKVVSVSSAKKEITLQTTAGNKVVDEDDSFYANLDGVANGDYVLAVVDADEKVNDAYVGNTVTGTVTRYTNKGEQTVNGTQYKVSACANADSDLKLPAIGGVVNYKNTTDECTLYLDSTGRIIAIKNAKELSGEDVCFVAYVQDAGKWGSEYEAYVYLPDGTKGVYTISSINNSTKESNIGAVSTGLYVYTLNNDGKSIALKTSTAVGTASGSLNGSDFQIVKNTNTDTVTIDHDSARYSVNGTTVYMDSATKFYMHNTTKAGSITAANAKEALTASTGLSSIKDNTTLITSTASTDLHVAYRVVNGRNIAIAVYGKNTNDVSAASDELVFIINGKWSKVDAGDEYYTGNAIFTGDDKVSEITIKGEPVAGLHAYKTDSQGRYEMDDDFNCGYEGILVNINGRSLEIGGITLKGLDGSNVKIWDVTDADKPTLTGTSFLNNKKDYYGYAVVDSTDTKNLLAVYICEPIEEPENMEPTGGTAGTSADPIVYPDLKKDGITMIKAPEGLETASATNYKVVKFDNLSAKFEVRGTGATNGATAGGANMTWNNSNVNPEDVMAFFYQNKSGDAAKFVLTIEDESGNLMLKETRASISNNGAALFLVNVVNTKGGTFVWNNSSNTKTGQLGGLTGQGDGHTGTELAVGSYTWKITYSGTSGDGLTNTYNSGTFKITAN